MKFKMRILHFSPNGNAQKVAEAIAKSQQAGCDKIPPAYPVENEKLLFICVDMKGSSPGKAVMDFCKDLTSSRTKNVAFLGVGSKFEALSELENMEDKKGVHVLHSHECHVKGGLFSKGVTEDAIKSAVEWAGKIVDSLH